MKIHKTAYNWDYQHDQEEEKRRYEKGFSYEMLIDDIHKKFHFPPFSGTLISPSVIVFIANGLSYDIQKRRYTLLSPRREDVFFPSSLFLKENP